MSSPSTTEVYYDGACPLCRRSAGVLRRLDITGRLVLFDLRLEAERMVRRGIDPARALDAMQIVAPDGRVTEGFHGLRALARTLPLLWPALPLLYAPLSGRLGPATYRFVADRRPICDDESCTVHAP